MTLAMKHFDSFSLMNKTLKSLILKELCPDGIWKLTDVMKSVLRRQISQLPKRTVSENETRYPTTPSGMRAFLDVFFARHFLQVQNSLLDYIVSWDFLDIVSSGHLRILDIGSGPAVASLAITDLLTCILEYLINIGKYPKHGILKITYVLNDTETICLGAGRHMLSRYFKIKNAHQDRVINSQTMSINNAFPINMRQLRRIKHNIGAFDIITFSYVVIPLNEDNGFNNLIDGFLNVEEFCSRNGVMLILQDRFRESLIRRIGKAIGVSTHKEEMAQQIYPDRDTGQTHEYSYYSCLYNPDKKGVTGRSYVA